MNRNGRNRLKSSPVKPRYVNSPLVEAVFEIRFPGDPAVECHRDEFYTKIRRKFPNVWVPNVEPGQPVALQPYHFKTEDGAETVMVAINRFAYTTHRYPGFEDFRPRVLNLVERFCRQFKIVRLKRTGLRYVNVIPFLREDGVIPWKRYFTVALTVPEASPDDFINVNLALESKCDKGAITTRIGCAKTADGSKEVFLLDFDFAKSEGLFAERLSTYVDESHEHTKKVFEGILSDSYKAVMRGEVIE